MRDTITKLLKAILGAIAALGILAIFVLCIVWLGVLANQHPYIAVTALAISVFVCLVVIFYDSIGG